jgi:hypothetical protein
VVEDSIEFALREIAAVRAAMDSLEVTLVARARSRGATWSELAGPLNLSKQGARKRHLATDPITARRSPPQTIEAYHAEFVAAMRAERESAG